MFSGSYWSRSCSGVGGPSLRSGGFFGPYIRMNGIGQYLGVLDIPLNTVFLGVSCMMNIACL